MLLVHKHELAIVSNDCDVGKGTRVWQFASVIRGAVIGEDCVIGSSAVVDAAKTGDRCLIGSGVQLHPGTRLGSDVFVGPGAIFCNDRWPRTSKEGFPTADLMGGRIVTTIVEDGASVGAGAIVLPGVRVGAGAMVAAGAVVGENVPPDSLRKRDGSTVPIGPVRDRARSAR